MPKPKILAFAGSTRQESYNQRLIAVAAQGAEEAGAQVTLINLANYPMPIFNQDLEGAEGMPGAARAFKKLLVGHDAMMIASPEYNSAISPLLKNCLDWASRAESKDEKPLSAYRGKWGSIMAASPGRLGGLRGLASLRTLLGNLGVTLLPDQMAIPRAFQAFAEDGSLVEKKQQQAVLDLGRKLTTTVRQFQKGSG